MINDVTTTFPNAPVVISQNKNIEYPNSLYEEMKKSHPDVRPLSCGKSQRECFQDCVSVAKKQSRWDFNVNENQFRITGTATTLVFRFKDDFTIEVRGNSLGQSEVHMRSRSRVGKSDLGANAKRINSYFNDLKKFWAQSK